MDEQRIKGLTQGAGREESRINQDFIDFLSKWSTPFLVVLALCAVSYWGWNQYKARQVAKVNEAIADYVIASGGASPSPDTLERLGDEHEGVRSIGMLARLDAADLYLAAVQRGLEPGVEYTGPDSLGVGDALDETRRAAHLAKAASLYQSVLTAARAAPGKEQLAVEAAFGLAAVAESDGKIDEARRHLAEAEELAAKIGFTVLAEAARKRAAGLSDGPPPVLYAADALPALPEPAPLPEPTTPEVPVTAPGSILDNPPLFPGAPATDDGAPAADEPAPAEGGDGGGTPADDADGGGTDDEDDGG